MDNAIISELIHFLQNSSDGQKLAEQSNLNPDDVHKVAQEIIPKMTSQVKNSPQTLNDLLNIIAQNKDNPESMLNKQPGFDPQKAHSEGREILQTLFGSSGQTAQMADEVSQKTGVSASQINSLLPMLAAMATKVLSGKTQTPVEGEDGNTDVKGSYLHQILGLLDTNKDGSVTDDLTRLGQQLMGKLFHNDKENKE